MEYSPSKLHKYIEKSELRIVNDGFRVRLSPALAKKYDKGVYDRSIKRHAKYIDDINALGIKYPGRANPIFYMYIVPDDNFIELLSFPFKEATRGGKPVSIYDLDGFDSAYGTSQNMCENKPDAPESISRKVNCIHEFAHMVHGMFFSKIRILSEGFAEVLPLYTMNYEEKFDEHREVIKNMKPEDIISPMELLSMGKDGSFGHVTRVPNKSCSFDWSYISSYLFVRGYITKLSQIHNLDRVAATQKFLEIVRSSQCSNAWLLFDLAAEIDMDKELLLDGKDLQLSAQSDIAKL